MLRKKNPAVTSLRIHLMTQAQSSLYKLNDKIGTQTSKPDPNLNLEKEKT